MDTSRLPASTRFSQWPWLVVLAVIVFVGFIRYRLLEMPLERDEGEYAYAGQLILQGIPPYELACNFKLPGTYYAYALGMACFGQTVSGVHLTLLAVNTLIIVFVYLLGRRLFGITSGLAACATYGIASVSPIVLGLATHANFFVILFAVPATLLLCGALKSKSSGALFFCGLLYGLAFLMKQQGIFFGLFGLITILVARVGEKIGWVSSPLPAVKRAWSQVGVGMARDSLAFGVGLVLSFGVTCLYLAGAGVFQKFWFWTFIYAHYYVSAMPWSYGLHSLAYHLDHASDRSMGLWLAAIAGILSGLVDSKSRARTLFAAAFWCFSFLATATGLYFRQHYFILVLPAFALLVGIGMARTSDIFRSNLNGPQARIVPGMVWTVFIGLLSWNLLCQSDVLFELSPEGACQSVYPQNPFVEAPRAAEYIRNHAPPGARIAVIGSEPEIYFYTRLHSATTYIYGYDLMEAHPYAAKMQREMIQQVESSKPEFLVYASCPNSWLTQTNSDREIFDWFERYTAAFYDRVGIVASGPDGEPMDFWDAGAAELSDSAIAQLHLTIYHRKPVVPPLVPSVAVHSLPAFLEFPVTSKRQQCTYIGQFFAGPCLADPAGL